MGQKDNLVNKVMPNGYEIHNIPVRVLHWKPQYGIYLIKLCKRADDLGEQMGKFIDVDPMTPDEFRMMLKGRIDPY